MIKVKDGYAKLIGTTYAGSSERVLLSNGGDFGLHTGRNNEANKLVRTDASGYIQAGWINTTSGDMGTTAVTRIYCSNDNFIRYKTPANFFSTLDNDTNQLSITVGSQNRKLTVAYATTATSIGSGALKHMCSLHAQERYNAYKIITNWHKSWNIMPTINIRGYAYNHETTIDCDIVMYHFNDNPINYSLTNKGSYAIRVWQAIENDVQVFYINPGIYFGMFNVFVYSGVGTERLSGWSMTTVSEVSGTEISKKAIATSITGNASTANKWTTARTLTIGATGKSVDGSEDVSWTLNELGASASTHTHNVIINGTTKTIAATGGTAVDLGSYLPLSGGTLFNTGQNTILNIKASSNTDSILRFTDSDTSEVYEILLRRPASSYGLQFNKNGTYYNLLHAGNTYFGTVSETNIPITINGTTYTFSSSSHTHPQYVDLTSVQTISGVKTFSSQIKSSVTTGTSPFSISSTTLVNNLNADMLDGKHLEDLDYRYTRTNYSFISPSNNSMTGSTDLQDWVTNMYNRGGYMGYSSITVGGWWWVRSLDLVSSVGTIKTSGSMIIYSGDGSDSKNYKHFLVLDANSDLYGITSNSDWERYSRFLNNRNYTDYVYNKSTSDSRFVNVTGDIMTGDLTVTGINFQDSTGEKPVLKIGSANKDTTIWRVYSNDNPYGLNSSIDGYSLKYLGSGDGNNNKLVLIADNQKGTRVTAVSMTQDGVITFNSVPYVGGTPISLSDHTHSVKINGITKTIAATSEAAVDLGSYLPLSGGTMQGSIKFTNSALPQKTLSYVCGIDAFANGGEMGWMSGPSFVRQYSPTLTGDGASGTWGINISGNADTVDGQHAYDFKQTWQGYAGKTYIGWIKLIEWTSSKAYRFSPNPFMLTVYRGYNSPASEAYTLSFNFGFNNASITQINGKAGVRIIEQFRVTRSEDGLKCYVEMYVNTSYTTYQNLCTFGIFGYSSFNGSLVCETQTATVTELAKITTSNGNTVAPGYIKEGSNDSYILLGGGGHKAVSDFLQGNTYWANVLVSTIPNVETQPTFYNTRIQGTNPALYIRNTNTSNDTYSIIRFGNSDGDDKAYIILNGPNRTEDGGNNLMTIRNNVGDLRLDSPTIITGNQTLYGLTSTCNAGNDADYSNAAVQIREYNFGGSQSDTWGNAPRLAWHWSGRVHAQIGLESSGDLKLSRDNFTTSYLLLHTGNCSVSGGGSSIGSSITVNIGGVSKTLTIPNTSSYTSYLKVHDIRGTNHLPNSTTYPEKNITAWFNNTGTPEGNWWSGITVKGWTNTYAVWQLCSYSSVGTANDYNLYFRNGINDGWGSWKTIVDNANYTKIVLKIGTATKGSENLPIYLNAGTPTACSTTLGVSITGNAATADRIKSHNISDTLSDKTTPGYLYHAVGGNTVVDKPSGIDAFGVFTMQTSSWQYGQLLMSSTGLYWRAAASLVGGWKQILDSSNFTTFVNPADFVTSIGTSGYQVTWTKNGTTNNITVPFASYAGYLQSHDTRNVSDTPGQFAAGARFQFKRNSIDGLNNGGTYHGVLHFKPHGGAADFSGSQAHQLGFTDNGNLYMRTSTSSTTWSPWKLVLYSDVADEKFVTLATDQTISGVKTFSTQQKFTVETGTPPFIVSSTTMIPNLNADLLDGYHESVFFRHLGAANIASVWSWGKGRSGTSGWNSTDANRGYGSQYGTNLDITGYHTWYHRFAMRIDGRIEYWCGINTTTMSMKGILAWTSELKDPANYYWANIKVSATSSTSTQPTFNTAYASNWFRSIGSTGWCNDTYGGGWYMTDSTWIRIYNNKDVYQNTGQIRTDGYLVTNGGLTVGATSPNNGTYKIHCTGKIYASSDIYAAHFYENSDIQLKTNIKSIINSDNVPKLREFDWVESGEHSYGFIAQELEEQGYSELVSTKEDGYKTVNYSAALSLVVAKLQKKISNLEKEIEDLKNKN